MTDSANKPAFNATRRQFAGMGAVAAAAAATGWCASANAAALPVTERALGTASAKLFAPEAGSFPGLVMFASPAASAAANAAIARDLAGQGWSVMLVDAPNGDPQQINRAAKAHAAVLSTQTGVAVGEGAFVLRSFSAAQPAMSLASRSERQLAVRSGVLFALPAAAAKSAAQQESLHRAARSLYRLAA
jgi:hypothetical protein